MYGSWPDQAAASKPVNDLSPAAQFALCLMLQSPEFYTWIRKTYMWHQLGQAVFFFLWGGIPFLVWCAQGPSAGDCQGVGTASGQACCKQTSTQQPTALKAAIANQH